MGIMTSKGAPVYNIGVMHYEDCTCLGCICGEHSRKVTVTDQTTGEVLGYVRKSNCLIPQTSCWDLCIILEELTRCLLCCSLGWDVYDKDENHIFSVTDGFKICGAGPIMNCGICGCWANSCAPGGSCEDCFATFCGCCDCCGITNFFDCSFFCRHTQYITTPSNMCCGAVDGHISNADQINCMDHNGCFQAGNWIRLGTESDNYCVMFPENEMFKDNSANRVLLLSTAMLQYSGDLSAENTAKVDDQFLMDVAFGAE